LIIKHHGDWWAASGGISDLDLTGRSVGLQRAATLKDEFDKTASHNEHHLSQIRWALSFGRAVSFADINRTFASE
jgi:hypothetical protein